MNIILTIQYFNFFYLQNNRGLVELDLSWNGFGNEGAAAIGEALKYNSSLEVLDLSNNRIGG